MKAPTLSVLFLLISCAASAQLSNGSYVKLRKALIHKINEYRQSKKVAPLQPALPLRKAAKQHSVYMAKHGILSHSQPAYNFADPQKRVAHFEGRGFEVVGENVMYTKKVALPINDGTLKNLANEIFNSWKNSPTHHANMINSEYDYGDIDFHFAPADGVLYATHVFGKKGVKIEGQQSQTAFNILPENETCDEAFDRFENIVANMGNAIVVEGNKVMFYYHSKFFFDKIFSSPTDGIAIDIILKDQLSCGRSNQLHYSPIHDGIMLKPMYRDEILKNNVAESDYRIIAQIATLPETVQKKEISCAVILIKNGRRCQYLLPATVPDKSFDLKKIEPQLNNPENVKLVSQGVSGSEDIVYEFESNSTTPINYPNIKSNDHPIHSIEIMSFSSVEGNTAKNQSLHKERARTIKNHLQKTLNVADKHITIDAKENWDKMYFQLRYYFADSLSTLSQDSLRTVLALRERTPRWDSLLFDQRKSIATIHYKNIVSDTSDKAALLALNLRTALLSNNKKLAEKALYEMYQKNAISASLFFETAVFQAISRIPELTQNTAAILSKAYYFDKAKTIEYLFYWMRNSKELSAAAKRNLLHLYTVVGDDLLDQWDVPAKRLAHVVHPDVVRNLITEDLESELVLNLNLTFIRYFGQTNDPINITKSFNYIATYYRSHVSNLADEIDLVLFFNRWSRFDLTTENLLVKFKKDELNEEALFILLQTMNFYTVNKNDMDAFERVNLKAFEANRTRWCDWVNEDYQLLRSPSMKRLYCKHCTEK